MDNHNWFACSIQAKHLQIENEKLCGNENSKVRMYHEFYVIGELLYDSDNSIITSEKENGCTIVKMIQNGLDLSEMDDSTPDGGVAQATHVIFGIRWNNCPIRIAPI